MEIDKSYLNKRILYRRYWGDLNEAKVVEFSPSGDYVKLEFVDSGAKIWYHTEDLYVIETLENKEVK